MMKKFNLTIGGLLLLSTYAQASISVDRTRVIYDEASKGVSVVVKNTDSKDPFLVQSWIENEQGNKVTEPLIALPVLQRIEPNQKKQVRISASKTDLQAASDKESLFYFNILGIPPKSELENAVEIVIQSRFKLFYRPAGLMKYPDNNWQKELRIEKKGNALTLTNPTPYHVVVININDSTKKVDDFQELIIKPNSDVRHALSDKQVQSPKMVVTYIDDYGAVKRLNYTCQSTTCSLINER